MTTNLTITNIPAAVPMLPISTLTVERGRLLAALKATAPHACKDETRFHLKGVAFELETRTKLNLVATNGHCLALASIPIEQVVPSEHAIVIVSDDDVRTAIKMLSGPRKVLEQKVTLKISETTVWLEVGGVTATYKTIDAEFPPYRQVVPERGDGGCHVQTLSPTYLAMMGESVAVFSTSRTRGMRVQLGKDELAPIRFDYDELDDGEFVGVVMPMRA